MADTWDYVRREWAKVEAAEPGPPVRIVDLDSLPTSSAPAPSEAETSYPSSSDESVL